MTLFDEVRSFGESSASSSTVSPQKVSVWLEILGLVDRARQQTALVDGGERETVFQLSLAVLVMRSRQFLSDRFTKYLGSNEFASVF
ncbi:hypothetical protein [Bradyrhizobium valentinum]|uniref:hypothetical protein n=1 Tax=Bradyrhizobium valentinum TaxID=1518501 RepID=UPI0012E349F2|nr:hypothetical protein [Bradyrhizobium valentinum]